MTNAEAAASLVALYAYYAKAQFSTSKFEEAVAMACGALFMTAGYDSLSNNYHTEVNEND